MAVKLSYSTFSKRIPKWVNLGVCYLSASCAASSIQLLPEFDQNDEKVPDFESKIQSLKNTLYPGNLVRVLDETDDVRSAVKLFKWASLQKRFQHTADTYFRIILKLGLAQDVDQVEAFCQNMIKDKCRGTEEALASLIDAFVKSCKLNEAIRVFAIMSSGGYKASIELCDTLLCALVKEKREFQDFVFVYKEMVKAGLSPSVNTLNYLLEALFQSGRVDSALNQFRRMKKKGCSPNSKTFEIVIKGLVEHDLIDDSISLLNEMKEIQCRPDLGFFSCLISLFCKKNRVDDAVQLYHTMKEFGYVPDLVICGELITALCQTLRLIEATKVLNEVRLTGLSPDDNVLVNMVHGFCKAGKLDEAASFVETNCNLLITANNELLRGYLASDKLDMAMSLFQKMVEKNFTDSESWSILIKHSCENGDLVGAYELLARMIVLSLVLDSSTYSSLITGNCKVGNFEYAQKLFRRLCIRSWLLDSVSYSHLIESLCLVGDIDGSIEVFKYMSLNGCSLEPSSFTELIKSTCQLGKIDEAIRLLFLAFSSGTSCSNSTFTALFLGLSSSKRFRDMLVVVGQMLVRGFILDAEVYCAFILSMSSHGRTKDCILFFNSMVNEGLVPDSETIGGLLRCLADHSELQLVSDSVMKLDSSTEILDADMFNLLISGTWKEGFRVEACRWLDVMLEKGWVPVAATHGLFLGSSARTETNEETPLQDTATRDNVSDILAEGLGEI